MRRGGAPNATGRRFRLASVAPRRSGAVVDDIVIAGRYLAYTIGYYNQVGRTEQVYVRNARRGKWVVRGIDPEVAEPGFRRTDGSEAVSLAVTARGTAAWGVHFLHGDEDRTRVQIVALGRDRAKRLLAAGALEDPTTRIDAFSLALLDGHGAARAYWMAGSDARTAAVD